MPKIEYFYSLLSPFTYLAGMGLEEVAASHQIEIEYHPTDMARVFTETGGLPVPQRHPFRQEYRLQELMRLSRMNDAPLKVRPQHWPVDATLASCSVIAVANSGGPVGVISQAFLKACWALDQDISDRETVARILSDHNQDMDELSAAIEDAREEYDANAALALEKGVFGAPFYIVDGERFWGQDRLTHLDWHLSQVR